MKLSGWISELLQEAKKAGFPECLSDEWYLKVELMFKHVLQGECSGLYNILETDSLIEFLRAGYIENETHIDKLLDGIRFAIRRRDDEGTKDAIDELYCFFVELTEDEYFIYPPQGFSRGDSPSDRENDNDEGFRVSAKRTKRHHAQSLSGERFRLSDPVPAGIMSTKGTSGVFPKLTLIPFGSSAIERVGNQQTVSMVPDSIPGTPESPDDIPNVWKSLRALREEFERARARDPKTPSTLNDTVVKVIKLNRRDVEDVETRPTQGESRKMTAATKRLLREYFDIDHSDSLPALKDQRKLRIDKLNEMILARNAFSGYPVVAVASDHSFDGGLAGWDGWIVHLVEVEEKQQAGKEFKVESK